MNKKIYSFTVEASDNNIRLDKLISTIYEEISRTQAKLLVKNRRVSINSAISTNCNYKVKTNDKIDIFTK